MKSRIWPLLLALLSAPCSAQSSDDLSKLIVSGELDRAETMARAGGDSLRVVLADILVLRGRLPEAESIYTQIAASAGGHARRATAALAELAARRGDRRQVELLARSLADSWRNRSGQWSAPDHLAAGRRLGAGALPRQRLVGAVRRQRHATARRARHRRRAGQ